MTPWEPTTGTCWGGRPIARRIADCAPRRRLVVTGTVVATDIGRWRRVPAYICRLDDDTGCLTLVFGGPRPVPGMVKGARCTVEATALSNGGALVLWNPHYRFEPDPLEFDPLESDPDAPHPDAPHPDAPHPDAPGPDEH